MHDRAWNVLDALHQLDELLPVGWLAGRKADPAVAHYRRCDSVPRRWCHVPVPDGLAVVVGVNINETGRNDAALRINLFRTAALETSDGRNASLAHCDIALTGRGSCSVYDDAATNNEIEPLAHRSSPVVVTGPRP